LATALGENKGGQTFMKVMGGEKAPKGEWLGLFCEKCQKGGGAKRRILSLSKMGVKTVRYGERTDDLLFWGGRNLLKGGRVGNDTTKRTKGPKSE